MFTWEPSHTFVVRQKALATKPCDKKIKGVLRGFSPKQSFGKREVLGEGKTFDLTKGCPSPKNKKLAFKFLPYINANISNASIVNAAWECLHGNLGILLSLDKRC